MSDDGMGFSDPSTIEATFDTDDDGSSDGRRDDIGSGSTGGRGSVDRTRSTDDSSDDSASSDGRRTRTGSGSTGGRGSVDRTRSTDGSSDDSGGLDVRPTTASVREQIAAETELEADEISGFRPEEGEVVLTDEARTQRAADSFERSPRRLFAGTERVPAGVDVDSDAFRVDDSGDIETTAEFRGEVRDAQERNVRSRIAGTTPGVGVDDVSFDDGGVSVDAEPQGSGVVGAIEQRTERTETPGVVAEGIDALTDGLERARPGTVGAIGATATTFRSESGITIPGTDRTTPGARDFDAFRESLEGPRRSIDSGIDTAVETATPDADSAPIDLADTPVGTNPALTAATATLGTEPGQRGAQAGVTSGLQAFNPAAIAQDASLVGEFGVRGADRAIDADADEIQTGIDVAEGAAEAAVDLGPAATSGALIDDPARGFQAGAGAATIGATGLATGAAAGAGIRGVGTAGQSVRGVTRGVADVGSAAARRTRRDVSDIDVTLTRDRDSGVIEFDGDLPDIGAGARQAREAIEARGSSPRLARDDRSALDDIAADVRFSAAESRRRVEDAVRRRPRRDDRTPVADTIADARFEFEEAALRTRDRLRRTRRDEQTPVQDLGADLDFSAREGRRRASDFAGDIVERVRDPFRRRPRRDERTPLTDLRADLEFSAGEARRRMGDIDAGRGGGFLADDGTGRARPFLGGAGAGQDIIDGAPDISDVGSAIGSRTPSRSDLPGVDDVAAGIRGRAPSADDIPDLTRPTVPRSLDDLGIDGEGGVTDLTLRIEGRGAAGQRTIDVEDLDGPDTASGAPLFRDDPVELDGDMTAPAGGSNQLDTTVDVGGGQVARMRQQTEEPRPLARDTQTRTRTQSDDTSIIGGVVGGLGGDLDRELDQGTGLDPMAGSAGLAATDTTPALGFDSEQTPAAASDTDTATTATTLLGADTVVAERVEGAQTQRQRAILTPGLTQTPALESPTTTANQTTLRPPSRPGRPPRPPRLPDLPDAEDGTGDGIGVGFDAEDFENPTRSLDEVDAELGDLDGLEGFDAP